MAPASSKKNKIVKTNYYLCVILLALGILALLLGYRLEIAFKLGSTPSNYFQFLTLKKQAIEDRQKSTKKDMQLAFTHMIFEYDMISVQKLSPELKRASTLRKHANIFEGPSLSYGAFWPYKQNLVFTEVAENQIKTTLSSKPSPWTKKWEKYAVPVKPDGRPMIAIVFDDLGLDKSRTQQAIDLPGPLTMSFLTYANHLKDQTRAARKAGHEIWMHVPMEPIKTTIDPGPKVLLTGSGPVEITNTLTWNLDRFDGYVGINNHMGSRFTANLAEMHIVMEELKRRGLAFLDSVTSNRSQARLAATTMGVDFATRNVFIDHRDDIVVINQQLSKIEMLARKQGYAIAIGHPREKTLKIIKPWLEALHKRGFLLVPVSAVLNR